ncbi:hypothetical protein [Bacillus massiliigorillae]|uniref:hypothetical protein n=1 Tax=Bacillus massiliigorillae TaxID=1243664 RepID=UPI00039C3CBC|nr:hypothetical protein [Bacillus massiliigorillae]
MENVKYAVQSLKAFRMYWFYASEEERNMISSTVKDESSACLKILGAIQSYEKSDDEYFPYE